MIEQTSSNIHQAQGRGTFARFRHQPAGSAKLVGATVILCSPGLTTLLMGRRTLRELRRSIMPVPSSWGSIHQIANMTHASEALIAA